MHLRAAPRILTLIVMAVVIALGASSGVAPQAHASSGARAETTAVRIAAGHPAKQSSRGGGRAHRTTRRMVAARRRAAARHRAAARRRAALRHRAAPQRTHARSDGASDDSDAKPSGEAAVDAQDASGAQTPASTTSSDAPAALADLGNPCAGADVPFSPEAAEAARAAATCLVNQERARQGLGALTRNPALESAAQGHTQDMITRDFFAHDSPSGASMLDRIRGAGYLTGATSFSVGENIAFAAGGGATPRGIVTSWMASPPHRANILNAAFREAGMGFVAAVPATAGHNLPGGGTLTQDFGLRR